MEFLIVIGILFIYSTIIGIGYYGGIILPEEVPSNWHWSIKLLASIGPILFSLWVVFEGTLLISTYGIEEVLLTFSKITAIIGSVVIIVVFPFLILQFIEEYLLKVKYPIVIGTSILGALFIEIVIIGSLIWQMIQIL